MRHAGFSTVSFPIEAVLIRAGRVGLPARAILLALLLAGIAAPPVLCAAPPMAGLAVFPFTPQRSLEKGKRLATFLHEEITRSVLRWGRVPVMSAEAAALWQRKFALAGLAAPGGGQVKQMGVEAVIHGTSQLVAGLAQVKVRVTGRSGDLLLGRTIVLRFDLSAAPPRELLDELLRTVFGTLFRGDSPEAAPQPPGWRDMWRFYARRAQAREGSGGKAPQQRLKPLRALAEGPARALAGRVALLEAKILLAEAVLRTKDGLARKTLLDSAMRQVSSVTEEEPWNADALALKGEIHFFLGQEFEARTEASIARVKNPLSGLAYLVLGLAAGLSTGEGGLNLEKALKANPFLRGANRPQGAPPLQFGLLEPIFARWDAYRARMASERARRENTKLNRAIALFEEKKWKQAQSALREAERADEYGHLPALYLARILIETDDPTTAAGQLHKLAVEFPQEAEIYYYLGIALENSEAYGEAMDAFQKALIEKPDDAGALLHLGTAAMGRRKWGRARETLRLLLARDDNHAEGWLNYGIVNYRLEQWRDADNAFLRALQLNPGWEEAERWRERIRPRLKQ